MVTEAKTIHCKGDPKMLCEDPTRELFVFCVLLNRQEMAHLFWEEGKEGVAAALVGSKLLKSMARELENDTELSEEMLEHADKFEDLALGVLNECWGEDELRTQLLLVRELYLWGELTCLRIAISGDHLNFIAHSACQALLNNIWMGKMALDTSIIRVGTKDSCSHCIFIPPLVPALIYFREDQKEEETLIEPLGTDERHYSISAGSTGRPVVARTKTNAGMIADNIPEGEELNKSMEMVVVHSSGSGLINNRQTPQVQFKERDEEEEYEAPLTEEGELDFRSSGKRISPLTRFYLFYDAPITTFMHNVISYILFLCLYSVVILTQFEENVLSPIDYVLGIWIFTLICEEIRQLITTEARSLSGKLLEYVGNSWNLFDLANIITFIVAFALRFFPATFTVARVLYSLNLMIFSFRLLHIFYINKEMGPKLIMIARMLKDLLFFIFILIIFILAYGIGSQSILYPNESRVWTVLQGIFHKSYFHVYGELFLEEIMNDDQFTCVANDSLAIATNQQRCPSETGTYVVPVLLGLYMLVTNVLLLNLLIAMFGYTFEKVQENTDKIWKFQRYDLIKEYSDRPPLAPPIIFFSHIFLLFRAITMGCCKKCRPGDNVMKVKLETAERKQLILWEYLNTENYLQQTRREKSQETDERVHDTQEKVDELKDLANEQDERLTRLEEQMLKSTMSLESIVQSQAWIIKSLQQNSLAAKEAPPELELTSAAALSTYEKEYGFQS
ncbi:transient receptor potential cation channel subfamily M member-like 2 [Branchiostoma floridae x Branchiostoma japonicum]